MRAKNLFLTISVLSLGMVGNVLADDVYVNLSVLDNLSNTSSPSMSQGPLFPIISSDSQDKPAKVKKPVRKASKAKKKAEKKLQIPAKEEIKVKVKEEKAEPKAKDIKEVKQPVADTGPFKVAAPEPKTDTVQAAPSVPVKSENLPQPEARPQAQEQQAENLDSLQTPEPEKVSVTQPQTQTPSAKEPQTQTPLAQKSSALPDANQTTDSLPQPAASEPEQPSLLVQNQPVAKAAATQVSEIFFAAESDELTLENQQAIDVIINGFENAKENKIAIYSFNLDDGEDSFRKKRISLNRAIAVRSYLLGKGYKNFSIKVVNLNEADGKENSVRIEELK